MKDRNAARPVWGALLTILVLTTSLLTCSAFAEEKKTLKAYSEENGYTYVYFGRYPQSIDGGNPEEGSNSWNWRKMYRDWEKAKRKELKLKIHDPLDPYDPGPLEAEPILWRVLSVDGEKIYLMSEYVLFASPIHPSMKEYRDFGGDFGLTALCAKLNGEFADTAFTEEEKEALLPFGTYGKVSLPLGDDLNDAKMGFSKKKLATRKAKATEYAIRCTGEFVYQASVGSHSPYWMREQSGTDARHGRATKQSGSVGHLHCDAVDVGARPVIYLAAEGFQITDGNGTKEAPYRLSAGAE